MQQQKSLKQVLYFGNLQWYDDCNTLQCSGRYSLGILKVYNKIVSWVHR